MDEIKKPFLDALRIKRQELGISEEELERDLVLGPGWIRFIENGSAKVDLTLFIYLANRLGVDFSDAWAAVPNDLSGSELQRLIYASESDSGIVIHFDYSGKQAQYDLDGASIAEFESVLLTLRDGLARAETGAIDTDGTRFSKSGAVVDAFKQALNFWPDANPSDLWWFVIYRAYLDPFNHPAANALGDLAQSWIRTSGWALEKVFVDNYSRLLAPYGIQISIEPQPQKSELLSTMKIEGNLNHDKVDILLCGIGNEGELHPFGVVHIKASFAERRTDDVPMSLQLISAGYFSPLLTLDCKSTPSEQPLNRGELGSADSKPSDKRLDIERDGVFSGCFSYNLRTEPTNSTEAAARISVCTFGRDDAFVEATRKAWMDHQKKHPSL